MLLLTNAGTDKLQLVTGSAGDIDVHASWVDNNTSTGAVTPGNTNTSPTTATTTDIVATPGSNIVRNVKMLNIRNAHASVSNLLTVLFNANGTTFELFKCTLLPGELLTYSEALGWDIYSADGAHKAQGARILFKMLASDDTGGQNAATAQPWFPTAGAVTVAGSTTYFFEGQLYTLRSAGAVSHTTATLFGGTATLTNIDYQTGARSVDANPTTVPLTFLMGRATSAAATVAKAASTAPAEDTHIMVSGIVRVNAGGTLIPQFIYSAAPGGTPTIKRGTYFRMWEVGDNNVVSQGPWA